MSKIAPADVKLVPAVGRAVDILRYLETDLDRSDASLSAIAKAVAINKSTCSGILKTLVATGFADYDDDRRTYRLGPSLIGLGARAALNRDLVEISKKHIGSFVRETGLTCVVFEWMPNDEYLVTAALESPRAIKVTIDVGQRFPPQAPVMMRAILAWQTQKVVNQFFTRYGTPHFTTATLTRREDIEAAMEDVRRLGYAISREEYYAANTAIAAPILAADRQVRAGLCAVGFSSQMLHDEAPSLGRRLRAVADDISVDLGGQSLVVDKN
ncbi:IclR family transcriptional regulator [Oceanibacterium hippocampi]|uniref:HTH-type transcriptional repressor AllR n=1 Tax=Oceanibacterium hippocampi TaxID=745714 RepID=A0A1Y5TYH7_9PROT|nr:IclR family transcriptional regulator [Oceanibacterium hippocampi]SLN74016.1 HTH-type transcriptional repressor AllR [Oceanibacterium hippocampi]